MKFGGKALMNILNLPWIIVSTSAIEEYIDNVKLRYVRMIANANTNKIHIDM